jgi:hypothetical protein
LSLAVHRNVSEISTELGKILRISFGRLHRAIVGIKPGHNPVELIAHEFEHIVEQLEGVRYQNDLASARGGTRVTAGQAVETNRAMAAGLLAARQVRESERDRKKAVRLARAF